MDKYRGFISNKMVSNYNTAVFKPIVLLIVVFGVVGGIACFAA